MASLALISTIVFKAKGSCTESSPYLLTSLHNHVEPLRVTTSSFPEDFSNLPEGAYVSMHARTRGQKACVCGYFRGRTVRTRTLNVQRL
jgi:hypothetical protein